MRQFDYDASVEPPAPALPVRIAAPRGEKGVLLSALADTGADCSVIPHHLANRLGLPRVDRVLVTGFGSDGLRADVHVASVELAGLRILARVVAFGGEAIAGRDLLNRLVLVLDGPARKTTVRRRRTRR